MLISYCNSISFHILLFITNIFISRYKSWHLISSPIKMPAYERNKFQLISLLNDSSMMFTTFCRVLYYKVLTHVLYTFRNTSKFV